MFWSNVAPVSSDLQLKAAEVNKTLSRNDGGPDKSLKAMKEDIQSMLAEMRKRQLAGQKSAAEDELEYGHTHKLTPARVLRTPALGHSARAMSTLVKAISKRPLNPCSAQLSGVGAADSSVSSSALTIVLHKPL